MGEARDQFNIKPRDKLVVAGDIRKGIAIAKAGVMKELALKMLGAISEEGRETVKKELRRRFHSDE